MNGEMYQICRIAAATRNALENQTKLTFVPIKYENKIEFQCLSQNREPYLAPSVNNWFDYCVQNGLLDIKLLVPVSASNRNLLGFSNATKSCLVCFYEEKATYFTSHWEFDSEMQVWNILYTEYEWENAPQGKPQFADETESFLKVLIDIKELAHKIDCDEFANTFQRAIDILNGSSKYIDNEYGLPLPTIGDKQLRLFEAASAADVFGAMGSWNDSPPYMAHEKGLGEEYEELSNELLRQISLAIFYAINE